MPIYEVRVITPFMKTLIIRAESPTIARSVIYNGVADDDILDVLTDGPGAEKIVGQVKRLSKADEEYFGLGDEKHA